MKRQPGDALFWQATNQGEIGRQIAVDQFLATDYPLLMMCDLDQDFPPDTLEKLRAHDLDMVTGHYMQRKTSTLKSVWMYTIDGNWPYIPYLYNQIPQDGMHRLASSGLGCVLIKREVVEAVKNYLSHWEPNSNPFEIGKVPEEAIHYGTWGSDMRFFYYAQRLGYELWGDASLDIPHAANIWVNRDIRESFQYNPYQDANRLNKEVVLATIMSKGKMTLNAFYARKMALEGVLGQSPLPEGMNRDQLEGQLNEVMMWIGQIEQDAPPLGFLERWYRDPQPALPDGTPVKFPTFKSKEELDAALSNPEVSIEGDNAEQTIENREMASRNHALSAAQILDGKQDQADAS